MKTLRLTSTLCVVMIFTCLCLSQGWAAKCNSVTLSPGLYHYTIDGKAVTVRVPSTYTDQKPTPVLLDLHGAGLNGDAERVLSGFDALSEEYGFIGVWPSGANASWNYTMNSTSSEVQYIRDVVDHIRTIANVDRSRVYVVGVSMGGAMTNTLVCEAADVFAAASPDSMQLTRSTDQCKPSRPVSVMEYHGYEDPLIPYDGGASFPVPGGPSITVPSAPESLRRWAQIMGCTGNPVDTSPPDGSGVVQTYETCNAGTQVGLGSIHGGHGLYAQLAIEEYTWAFLTRFTLPLTPAEFDRCPGDPSNKGSDDPSGAGAADAASGDSGGGGSGGSCFIATATYGSLHPHVAVLREFRDKHLLTNPPGRAFVRLYHRYSPGIVAIMERHDVFRTASRGMLTPVVYAIKYPCGPLVAMFLAGGVVLAMWRRRRNRGRNRVPGQRE